VVTDQVVEAEDADFEDCVVRTQTQVHDGHHAHKLCTRTTPVSTNTILIVAAIGTTMSKGAVIVAQPLQSK